MIILPQSSYSVSDNDFGKARGRFSSKAYIMYVVEKMDR